MLKPGGSWSFAVGNLSAAAAIGGGATGASLAAASPSGRPIRGEPGGKAGAAAGAWATVAGGAAGAAAAAAGGGVAAAGAIAGAIGAAAGAIGAGAMGAAAGAGVVDEA